MREPPARVRFVGHPIIATPICGLCALSLYAWSQETAIWPVGLGAVMALMWTIKASQIRGRYKAWQRAWNSMAEPMGRRSIMPAIIAVVAVGGVATYDAGYLTADASDVSALIAAAVVAAATGAIGLVWRVATRWARRRRATPRTAAVTVCVTRPVMPVPTLADAYEALPEHCWKVLGR